MVTRVQNVCGTPVDLSMAARVSDFSIDVVPTRTAGALAGILDSFDDGGIFLARRAIDFIILVFAVHGHVGWNLDDLKLVDIHEFVGFG